MKNSFFNIINARYIDHFAVTTNSFNSAVQDWLLIPGSKLLRGPNDNNRQQVRYAFIQLSNSSVIEVLSPLTKESPIVSHIQNGGGLYHVCFAVDDIIDSLRLAEKNGASIVVKPIKDVAFDERRISFILHPDHGLIELVEAQLSIKGEKNISQILNVNKDPVSNTRDQVVKVINDIFPDTKSLQKENLAYGCVDKWDSLGQLQLIMAIENMFEIKIPVEKVVTMHSLTDIVEFLK